MPKSQQIQQVFKILSLATSILLAALVVGYFALPKLPFGLTATVIIGCLLFGATGIFYWISLPTSAIWQRDTIMDPDNPRDVQRCADLVEDNFGKESINYQSMSKYDLIGKILKKYGDFHQFLQQFNSRHQTQKKVLKNPEIFLDKVAETIRSRHP